MTPKALLVTLLAPLLQAQHTPLEVDRSNSSMRAWIERYESDRALLRRRFEVPMSKQWAEARLDFHREWFGYLESIEFDALSQDAKIDYLLLRNLLRHSSREFTRELAVDSEVAKRLPFAGRIVALVEARREVADVDAEAAAGELDVLRGEIEAAREGLSELDARGIRMVRPRMRALKRALREWFDFYADYDPMVTWWAKQPHAAADKELDASLKKLEKLSDADDAPFRGEPIGRSALLDELALAMLPYTPEELIAIGEQEFEWCDERMLEASRELGYGDDWKKALDHVKDLHVKPGEQPAMIRDLAHEAIEFVESRKLVTVPAFCKRSWRMTMMSAARQKISPYFLGGETIQVSFPTEAMEHRDKLMSMRGNNPHFARATVHHELIPGHHLQGFMTARHRPYRKAFRTPFWLEGWALYWEMLLWDLDFQRSAEDRVGMLFWRMHRCARIVFSLSYHLGEMSEQECIDYLVERVGHERNNATAEVRRSVIGGYGPLYQAAYMLGALQLKALRREVVDSGRMTELAFHDAVLRENAIPIEFVRASLIGQKLTRDFETSWRFRGR